MVIKPPSYEAFLELVRTDRLAFIEKAFQELHHGAKFHRALYQNAIDWELKRCEQGAGQNLIVFNLPPRHLKSEMISVIQSAWILAHEPGAHIISLSYGSDLVTKLSNQVRTIMNSQWYKDAFPNTRISPKKNTETDFETTAGGRRYATTVNAELTGHGAKYILIDDPHNVSQLPSTASLTSDLNWFKQGVWSRFEGHADGAFIVIMQRYHQQDLTAYLTQEFGFRQLKLEAIAKEDSNVQIGPNEFWERKKGDVLNPDWMSLEALQKTKQIMGDAAFEAQYQQDTTFGMGCLYKPEYFLRYDRVLPRHHYEFVIAAFDTASTLSEDSSFSACVIGGVIHNEIHIIRVWRDKLEFPKLLNATRKIIDNYAPSHLVIENTSLGTSLLHKLWEEYKTGIHHHKPDQNKLLVAESFLDIVTANRVRLPHNKPWLKTFEDELFGFPGGPFNDQVDAMNLLLRAVRRNPAALSKLKYEKEPSQKAYPGIHQPMKSPVWW